MNHKNPKDVYNPKHVVKCKCKVYSSRDLLVVGITCGCKNVLLKQLEKKYNWVTFLLYSPVNDSIIYIETNKTISRRINDLSKTKSWVNESIIRVNVQFGEDLFLGFYKPKYNEYYIGTKRESNLYCLDSKLTEKYVPLPISPPFTKTKDIDSNWCYIDVDCLHMVPCKIQQVWNDWKNDMGIDKIDKIDKIEKIERWDPLDKSMIKKEYQLKTYKHVKYNPNVTISFTKDFCFNIIENVDVKEKSLQGYKNVLSSLISNGFIDYIYFPSILMDILKKRYSKATVKQQVLVVKIFLDNLDMLDASGIYNYNDILEEYNDIHRHLNSNQHSDNDDQKKSTRQESNWTSWESLENVLHQLQDNITGVDDIKYQEYLGLKLLLHQQSTRNDYCTLKFQDYDSEKDNYIDIEKNEIVWNDYKTVSTHGKNVIDIKEKVKRPLKEWINKKKGENVNYLFMTKNKTQMSKDNFGLMIREIFKRHLGKNIGVQMIRVIKVSEARKGELTIKEENELAKEMMHSSIISRRVYRKV
jgi:hypothetical protein